MQYVLTKIWIFNKNVQLFPTYVFKEKEKNVNTKKTFAVDLREFSPIAYTFHQISISNPYFICNTL